MAKIGYEVEGMMKGEGIKTYFCDAKEFSSDLEKVYEDLYKHGVDMIYICDHHNELDLRFVAAMFEGTPLAVTVELTELKAPVPPSIKIFWNVSQASYAQSRTMMFLRKYDQIKIEHEKHVLAFVAGNAVTTYPKDFEEDIEL